MKPHYLNLRDGELVAYHRRKPIRTMFYWGVFCAAVLVGADVGWTAILEVM